MTDENLHKSFQSLILVSFVKFLHYKNTESAMSFQGIFAFEVLFGSKIFLFFFFNLIAVKTSVKCDSLRFSLKLNFKMEYKASEICICY